MYAVINTGGKQYRLTEGDVFEIERLEGGVGEEVVFDEVLLVGDSDEPLVGSPQVKGAQVIGTIVEQKKGKKVVVFKFKKRKMYRRKTGHRQLLTKVRVESISDGTSAPKKAAKASSGSEAKSPVKKAEKAKKGSGAKGSEAEKAAPKEKKAKAKTETKAKKASSKPTKPSAAKADSSKEGKESKEEA